MKTVSFFGSCDALAGKTLVSKRFACPYITKRFRITFNLGCNDLLKIRIIISNDNYIPELVQPEGASIFADQGQVDYVVGDNDQIIVEHDVHVDQAGSYIKVYAWNDDIFNHAIKVIAEVELL
jgi:hypothetical protein